jgi:regulatory protein SWI6
VIRSVMVAHNYDQQLFYDLITILKDIICIPDKKNRSVIHHICHSSSIKGRGNSCIYYMQCLLNLYSKARYDEQISSEMVHSDNQNSFTRNFANMLNSVDICGDTAANIAARLGNRQLFDMLAQAGADCSVANFSSLKPSDYGFETPFSKVKMSFLNF